MLPWKQRCELTRDQGYGANTTKLTQVSNENTGINSNSVVQNFSSVYFPKSNLKFHDSFLFMCCVGWYTGLIVRRQAAAQINLDRANHRRDTSRTIRQNLSLTGPSELWEGNWYAICNFKTIRLYVYDRSKALVLSLLQILSYDSAIR